MKNRLVLKNKVLQSYKIGICINLYFVIMNIDKANIKQLSYFRLINLSRGCR